MKVIDSSRTPRDICKIKNVKCVRVIHGKAYAGCMHSSILELSIANNWEREIKAPSKIWRIQSKPVNPISVYKDWLYGASAIVEGSNIKEWRRWSKPQVSILPNRGTNVLAMEVTEDFRYFNCNSSTSVLQVTDEEGRRRFHGAFTGGHSAGYYNTVGSKKGWTPQTFTSSQKNRTEIKQQNILNFLDDDEKVDLEGHSLGTSMQFDTFGFTATELARKQVEKEQKQRFF